MVTFASLQPTSICEMELRNKIVMPAMVSNFALKDGQVSDRLIAYYEARAKGGVGLIIVEATYVHPSGKGFRCGVGIYKDELVPGLKRLVDAVHRNGAKIAIQLYHAGRQTSAKVTGRPVLAPSVVTFSPNDDVPKELSREEIDELTKAFRDAALRAKKAGFDAVEIHGGHGYLLNQFLSPYTNKRTDLYGGSLENRLRFPLNVIQEVRETVGENFPIIFRLSAEEGVEGGLTLNETRLIAKELVRGGVNALHITAGIRETGEMITPPMAVPQGCYIEYAASIKEAIDSKVPVISVGRIKDLALADKTINKGKADLISMGRALIADPELPGKVMREEFDQIRKCIGCNEGCIGRLSKNLDISCMINPRVGHEMEYDLSKPASKIKNVMVIGGGPGGLEAARIAALRGHHVTLYEKNNDLGGQVRVASIPPYKKELEDLINYLVKQVKKLNVDIRTRKEVDIKTVQEAEPDVVIVASGGIPVIPTIPGVNNENVTLANDVLMEKFKTGERVVVIGGGLVGCETAEFLGDKGKKVTVIEMLSSIASDVEPRSRKLLLRRMAEKKIEIMVETTVEKIISNGVIVNSNGNKETVTDVDTVILATGYKNNKTLFESLKGLGLNVFAIGDCIEPRNIMRSLHEGFKAAYGI